MFDKIKSFFKSKEQKVIDYLKVGKTTLLLGIIGFTLFILLSIFFPPLAAFASIIGNVSIGLFVWGLIDKYILKGIDTAEEIKKGNIAYAIVILAFVLLIAAGISAS